MTQTPLDSIQVPRQFAHMRRIALDGAMLLFDRDSGMNARCEGPETAHLKQVAPRMIQFGITNACNLACSFCSRDVTAKSAWTFDDAFKILSELSSYGVLEVAFGGGEPLLFPRFTDLIIKLYDQTQLAVNFTTNGINLTAERLEAISGKYGQIRLSLYENNDWRQRVTMLTKHGARFGINCLVTPERLSSLETTILELCQLGCRDILLLSYNGYDQSMHLTSAQACELSSRVSLLAKALTKHCQIKLGVCWGEQMQTVPRLFAKSDCGAGRDFVVIGSAKTMQPCSFHQYETEVKTAADVMQIWNNQKDKLLSAALMPGCARTPDAIETKTLLYQTGK